MGDSNTSKAVVSGTVAEWFDVTDDFLKTSKIIGRRDFWRITGEIFDGTVSVQKGSEMITDIICENIAKQIHKEVIKMGGTVSENSH